MRPPRYTRLKLRQLVLGLALAGILATLANSLYAIYHVQRDELILNALNANHAYARKLAEVSDAVIRTSRKQLAYSAGLLAARFDNHTVARDEVRRLMEQTDAFDSAVIVRADGVIAASAPASLNLEGLKSFVPGPIQSLLEKRPIVTDPFISLTGDYVVSLSHPVFGPDGAYLGYVAGHIFLEQQNLLHGILKHHHYDDGSYVYVVDRYKTLIYHPDMQRVGERIPHNTAIDKVSMSASGAEAIVNSKGIPMLAGYAPITEAGWGVIAQRPRTATLAGLNGLIVDVFAKIAPLGLLTLLIMWLAANAISRPLRHLARCARDMDQQGAESAIGSTRSWYFEAEQLRGALLKGVQFMQARIDKLRVDSATDPMTGLLNRRGLEDVLERHATSGRAFSIIILDIDRFKVVNDTYGHGVGDEVIRQLAGLIQLNARPEDALCRAGGDEFLLLLPGTDTSDAAELAERLRQTVETHAMPGIGAVTISMGIAYWSGEDPIESVLKQADDALYGAKRQGRNQYRVA
jgi:diguanylate cyclase (GGDEF)-like protein